MKPRSTNDIRTRVWLRALLIAALLFGSAAIVPGAVATHTDAQNMYPTNYTDQIGGCNAQVAEIGWTTHSPPHRLVLVIGMAGSTGDFHVKFKDNQLNAGDYAFKVDNGATTPTFNSAMPAGDRTAMDVVIEKTTDVGTGAWYMRVAFTPVRYPIGGTTYEWDATSIYCFDTNALKTWTKPASPDSAMSGWIFTFKSGDDGLVSDTAFLFDEDAVPAVSAPSAPQNLAATNTLDGVDLSWDAPADDGGAAIIAYKIYRGTTSGSLTLRATVGDEVTTYSDSGLTSGQTYYYAVSAVNDAGGTGLVGDGLEGAQSAEVSGHVLVPAYGNVTNLATTNRSGSILLTWTHVEDPNVIGYRIYRNSTLVDSATDRLTTSWEDTNVTGASHVTYQYALAPYTADLTGNWTGNVTGGLVLAAPSGFAVTNTSSAIVLSWTQHADTNTTGYRITRNGSVIADVDGRLVTSWSDTNVSARTVYGYQIEARSAKGGSGYVPADQENGHLVLATQTPQDFNVLVVENGLRLTWTPVEQNEDFAGYRIYRATSSTFQASWATLYMTTTSFDMVDRDGEPGVMYYYRVSSYNILDDESEPTDIQGAGWPTRTSAGGASGGGASGTTTSSGDGGGGTTSGGDAPSGTSPASRFADRLGIPDFASSFQNVRLPTQLEAGQWFAVLLGLLLVAVGVPQTAKHFHPSLQAFGHALGPGVAASVGVLVIVGVWWTS